MSFLRYGGIAAPALLIVDCSTSDPTPSLLILAIIDVCVAVLPLDSGFHGMGAVVKSVKRSRIGP